MNCSSGRFSILEITSYRGCLAEQTREQRDQLRTDENDAATAHELFYTQLGVKLCSMAGGGIIVLGTTLIPLLSTLF